MLQPEAMKALEVRTSALNWSRNLLGFSGEELLLLLIITIFIIILSIYMPPFMKRFQGGVQH